MKRIIFGSAVFLLLIQTGCLAQVQPVIRPEVIKEPAEEAKYTWDFGKAKQGTILTHVFKITNESSRVLNILNATATCGCTTPDIKNPRIKPKESTDIEVKFNSKGFSGTVTKYVYVNTDDLDNPVIRLIIKADIVK